MVIKTGPLLRRSYRENKSGIHFLRHRVVYYYFLNTAVSTAATRRRIARCRCQRHSANIKAIIRSVDVKHLTPICLLQLVAG